MAKKVKNQSNKRYDIITVGRATVDVFVKTKSPEILTHKSHDDVCYALGSKILIKELYFKTGGGATNTAVSFSRLSLKTGFLGLLGRDLHSKIVEEELKHEKIIFLGKKVNGQVGYSVILFGLHKDRTILTYRGLGDGLSSKDVPWKKLNTKWIYLSSLMGESFETAKLLVSWAKKNKVQWAFNPSMYLAKQGLKKLKPLLAGCSVLVLNKEEAQVLIKSKKDTFKKLQRFARFVVITDGPRDVHAFDGKIHYILTPRNDKVVETTGAGDAFASGVVAGMILKNNPKYALQLGYIQSTGVLKAIGAKDQLYTKKQAERLIKTMPSFSLRLGSVAERKRLNHH